MSCSTEAMYTSIIQKLIFLMEMILWVQWEWSGTGKLVQTLNEAEKLTAELWDWNFSVGTNEPVTHCCYFNIRHSFTILVFNMKLKIIDRLSLCLFGLLWSAFIFTNRHLFYGPHHMPIWNEIFRWDSSWGEQAGGGRTHQSKHRGGSLFYYSD